MERSRWTASFSACHCAFSASAFLFRLASSFSSFAEALLRSRVSLLLQRLALDLQLHDAARNLVQLRRHGVDLGAQLGRRLVDQVDRLVRQEAVRDVAVRQHRRRHQGRILNTHPVVHLVALLQAAQDRDGVLDRRLVDQHRLEAALQGGILLDVLAIFIQRRGADAVQLAARQHGLEQVAGVHGPFGLARRRPPCAARR